jgi:hypothetical protein
VSHRNDIYNIAGNVINGFFLDESKNMLFPTPNGLSTGAKIRYCRYLYRSLLSKRMAAARFVVRASDRPEEKPRDPGVLAANATRRVALAKDDRE